MADGTNADSMGIYHNITPRVIVIKPLDNDSSVPSTSQAANDSSYLHPSTSSAEYQYDTYEMKISKQNILVFKR